MENFTERTTPAGLYDPQFEHDNCGIGAFISAIINFIILAFVLFCLIKGMNALMNMGHHKEEEKPAEPAAPAAPTQEELLAQILAELKAQNTAKAE